MPIEPTLPLPDFTTPELCEELRCSPFTLSKSWRKWGLRPLQFGKGFIWPRDQVAALKARRLKAELPPIKPRTRKPKAGGEINHQIAE